LARQVDALVRGEDGIGAGLCRSSVGPEPLAFAAPDHIVFGSDYPYAPTGMATRFTQSLDAYEGLDHASVNRDNALRLLPRLAAATSR
jgi:hypothetical protein